MKSILKNISRVAAACLTMMMTNDENVVNCKKTSFMNFRASYQKGRDFHMRTWLFVVITDTLHKPYRQRSFSEKKLVQRRKKLLYKATNI